MAGLAAAIAACAVLGVLSVERVASETVRLARVATNRTHAATRVLSMGNRLEVCWVHAAAVATRVVEVFALNRPDEDLVVDAVSRSCSASVLHLAVPSAIERAQKEPTSRVWLGAHLRFEPVEKGAHDETLQPPRCWGFGSSSSSTRSTRARRSRSVRPRTSSHCINGLPAAPLRSWRSCQPTREPSATIGRRSPPTSRRTVAISRSRAATSTNSPRRSARSFAAAKYPDLVPPPRRRATTDPRAGVRITGGRNSVGTGVRLGPGNNDSIPLATARFDCCAFDFPWGMASPGSLRELT